MTRILMTADTSGGVWTYAVDLGATLRRYGVEVVLATMGTPPTDHQRVEVDRAGIRLHASSYQLEWMPDAWDEVERAGEWLMDLVAREDPDLVHLNGYCHAHLPWDRPVLVVAHSCVYSWWEAVSGGEPPPQWQRYRERVTAGLGAADHVVAPTRSMLRAVEQHYGPLPSTQVIANGRNPKAVRPRLKEPFVLSAGRLWDEAKNLVVLDRAAASVPWKVCVAGDQHHPDGRDVVPRNVEVLGQLAPEVLAAWMGRAAIYAAPARYEPFGLAALEAGLAGCALVLGDIPSQREVWGSAAVFVPPDDASALAAVLDRLARDPRKRGQLARAARMHALSYHTERMADAYAAVYGELLADAATTGAMAALAR